MDALRQVIQHETVDELALLRRQLQQTRAELARVRNSAARACEIIDELYYTEEDDEAHQLVVAMTALRSILQQRQHHRM